MATRRVKCLSVTGATASDFRDLPGTVGKLCIHPTDMEPVLNWYNSDKGNSVNFTRKRVIEKDKTIKVFTKIGNVFKFELA